MWKVLCPPPAWMQWKQLDMLWKYYVGYICFRASWKTQALKFSERGNSWIQDTESQKHQAVAGRALSWDEASPSPSLCENDKHDLVTDEGFVCSYISLCLCFCSLHRWVSLPDFPPSPHISIFLLLSCSISSVCVNSPSLCLCHITQSAQDAAAEACWQESRRWCRLPRQEWDLSPEWIHIWYWFLHGRSVWIKPVSVTWCGVPVCFTAGCILYVTGMGAKTETLIGVDLYLALISAWQIHLNQTSLMINTW